jgi:cysteine desulfurase/selenocysteine lyase
MAAMASNASVKMKIMNIRKDFPVLSRKIGGKPIVYMDSACMSLRPVQVIDALNDYYKNFPACAGRSIHKLGREVTDGVKRARDSIKRFFNAKNSKEIVFTKNTTEAINLVANSYGFEKGDVVVTSDREHNSNLMPWQILKETKGIVHEVVKSNDDNTFNIDNFKKIINDNKNKIKLVSMVHTSNLDGYTLPVKEIIKIAHENKALVMLDAAQSAPHKEIDVRKLDVDFLACSGHKMLGPSGIGILYAKHHLLEKLPAFMVGGDTVINTTYESFQLEEPPEKFEAGLQHYAGMIGMGEAARYLMKIGKKNINKHEIKLNKIITNDFNNIKKIDIIGPQNSELRSGIISFNIKNMDPHEVAGMLDASANIMVRSGMHCVHSWFNAHNIKGSVRASLYLYNTEEEARLLVEEIKKIVKIIN